MDNNISTSTSTQTSTQTPTSTSTTSSSYQPYDQTNALILAQQNAGNIEYLKQQLTEIKGLYKEVEDISGNVVIIGQQVQQIAQAQSDYATQNLPSSPPIITGTETDTTNTSTNTY